MKHLKMINGANANIQSLQMKINEAKLLSLKVKNLVEENDSLNIRNSDLLNKRLEHECKIKFLQDSCQSNKQVINIHNTNPGSS